MSHTHAATASSSSKQASNFQSIFDNALDAYKKHTKKDLLAQPFAVQLRDCDSSSSILHVLHQQVQEFNQYRFRSSDDRLTKWLDPTVKVLNSFSATLEGVGMVCLRPSPVRSIRLVHLIGKVTSESDLYWFRSAHFSMYLSQHLCACVGRFNINILQAAKDVHSGQDSLINIFERIEMFFRRLEIYLEVPPNKEMVDTITRIMVEILSILAVATNELKQGRMSESLPHQRYCR